MENLTTAELLIILKALDLYKPTEKREETIYTELVDYAEYCYNKACDDYM